MKGQILAGSETMHFFGCEVSIHKLFTSLSLFCCPFNWYLILIYSSIYLQLLLRAFSKSESENQGVSYIYRLISHYETSHHLLLYPLIPYHLLSYHIWYRLIFCRIICFIIICYRIIWYRFICYRAIWIFSFSIVLFGIVGLSFGIVRYICRTNYR